MTQSIRILNAFSGALFLVMALVTFVFLSAGRDGFAGGPAGRWAPAGWTALFALFALLAFVNLRRAGSVDDGGGLILLNGAAALPMLAGLVLADAASRALFGASALPFALTALLLAARRAPHT